MDRKKLFFLKFAMGGANFLANLVGVAFAQGLSTWVERPLPDFVWKNPLVDLLEIFFSPMAFAFISVLTAIYERPLR